MTQHICIGCLYTVTRKDNFNRHQKKCPGFIKHIEQEKKQKADAEALANKDLEDSTAKELMNFKTSLNILKMQQEINSTKKEIDLETSTKIKTTFKPKLKLIKEGNFNENEDSKQMGNIYILWNPIYQYYGEHVYKVGLTQNIEKRINGYTTSYPEPSKYVYISPLTSSVRLVETLTFEKLKDYRLSDGEFFKCELSLIRTTIEQAIQQISEMSNKVSESLSAVSDQIEKSCEFQRSDTTQDIVRTQPIVPIINQDVDCLLQHSMNYIKLHRKQNDPYITSLKQIIHHYASTPATAHQMCLELVSPKTLVSENNNQPLNVGILIRWIQFDQISNYKHILSEFNRFFPYETLLIQAFDGLTLDLQALIKQMYGTNLAFDGHDQWYHRINDEWQNISSNFFSNLGNKLTLDAEQYIKYYTGIEVELSQLDPSHDDAISIRNDLLYCRKSIKRIKGFIKNIWNKTALSNKCQTAFHNPDLIREIDC